MEVDPRDVLFGRGRGIAQHDGNLAYVGLISSHVEIYKRATSNREKWQVTNKVVVAVKKRGGRFLRDSSCGCFLEEASDDVARAKVGQALRHQIRSKKANGHGKNRKLKNKKRSSARTKKKENHPSPLATPKRNDVSTISWDDEACTKSESVSACDDTKPLSPHSSSPRQHVVAKRGRRSQFDWAVKSEDLSSALETETHARSSRERSMELGEILNRSSWSIGSTPSFENITPDPAREKSGNDNIHKEEEAEGQEKILASSSNLQVRTFKEQMNRIRRYGYHPSSLSSMADVPSASVSSNAATLPRTEALGNVLKDSGMGDDGQVFMDCDLVQSGAVRDLHGDFHVSPEEATPNDSDNVRDRQSIRTPDTTSNVHTAPEPKTQSLRKEYSHSRKSPYTTDWARKMMPPESLNDMISTLTYKADSNPFHSDLEDNQVAQWVCFSTKSGFLTRSRCASRGDKEKANEPVDVANLPAAADLLETFAEGP